jgi:hypothetical protein
LFEPIRSVSKLAAKSRRAVYLGPDLRRHGDVFWVLSTRKLSYSRSATFNECVFPFSESRSGLGSSPFAEFLTPVEDEEPTVPVAGVVPVGVEEEEKSDDSDTNSELSDDEGSDNVPPRRSARIRHPPARMTAAIPGEVHAVVDPTTLRQALETPQADEWQAAAELEFNTLNERGTWTLTDLPRGRTAIGTVWVLKTKRNADGSVERLKVRLCVQGCRQRRGVDYFETYAPVVKMPSVRAVLALATWLDMDLAHLDVVSAFLNGMLDEEIYVKQPTGPVASSGPTRRIKSICYIVPCMGVSKPQGRGTWRSTAHSKELASPGVLQTHAFTRWQKLGVSSQFFSCLWTIV